MPNEPVPYHAPADPDRFAAINRPTLVVDRARAERNIARMAAKAAASGVRFRPHFKTHNSLEVGAWFGDPAATPITVSSVAYARRFADGGWRDITIAFPLNVRAMPEIAALAAEVRLGVLLDSTDAAAALEGVEPPVDVWLDVDAGYGRSGIAWDDTGRLADVGRAVTRGRHRLRGVMTHAGNTYAAPTHAAIAAIYRETASRLASGRTTIEDATSRHGLEISIGDTPACSIVERFEGVDEVRPGNFVFYDLQQLALGACDQSELALAVACPVVGVYPARGEFVVHGGSVHLSRDAAPGPGGTAAYGRLAVVRRGGWDLLAPEDAHVRSVSQEHGVVRLASDVLHGIRVGDLAFIVPAHACMPANLIRDWVFV